MIIACPDCESPFELRDENIAALVQLECPSCTFRMILDFAAANDASLVEDGMKMASGFRSAADYRAAVAVPLADEPAPRPVAPAPEPELPAAPAPEPVAPEPVAPEPAPEPVAPIAAEAPAPEPTAPEPAPQFETPAAAEHDVRSTMIGIAAPNFSDPGATPAEPAAAAPKPASPAPMLTLDAPAPDYDDDDDGPTRVHDLSALKREAASEEAPTQLLQPQPAARASRAAPEPAPEAAPEPAPAPEAVPEPVERPAESQQRRIIPEAPKSAPIAASVDFEDDLELPRTNPFLVFVVVLTTVLALGLVAASLALEGTPDPRPLLQKLYEQNM